MALSGKVAFNTGLQVISKIITTVISLAAVALITRYLGIYDFGRYTTAVTFVTFFSIAGDFGLTLVTTQLISRPGANQRQLLSNLFSFRVVTAALILVMAPIVVLFFPYDLTIKQGVVLASLALFFVLLNQIFTSFFQKELRADKIAIAEIISRVIFFASIIGAVLLGWRIYGVLWAMIIGNAASFIFHYYFSRSFVKIGWAYDRQIWLDIGRRSWPLILTIVLNLLYLRTDTLLLSLMKSPVDVGLYAAAYKVIDVIVTIPFVLGGTILPILTNRWESKKTGEYNKAWQKFFDATSLLVWPAVAGGFVLALPIMRLVAGDEFIPAAPILRVLIVAIAFIFFSSMYSHTMISLGAQKRLIGAYAFTAITSLILYFVLIPIFSTMGAAWVTVYSELAMAIAGFVLVKKQGIGQASWSIFSKTLAASVIMAIIVSRLPIEAHTPGGMVIAVLSGGLIYGVLLYVLGAVKAADIKALANFRN